MIYLLFLNVGSKQNQNHKFCSMNGTDLGSFNDTEYTSNQYSYIHKMHLLNSSQ